MDRLAQYVEDVAMFYEEAGLPRIAGRILGLLLVCDPPTRSTIQLADELEISKGSVSTMTRRLTDAGMIERVAMPGERATFFRLKDDGFERLFAFKMRALTSFRPLADRGIEMLEQSAPSSPSAQAMEVTERTRRLRNLRGLYAFLEHEMPRLIERWRAERPAWIEDPPEEAAASGPADRGSSVG